MAFTSLLTPNKAYFLLFACAIYACFGSPTPDSFRIVEALIAVPLLAGIGFHALQQVFRKRFNTKWQLYGVGLFIYGLSIPVIMGVFSGYGYQAILRDLIPFLFLLLPVFLRPAKQKMHDHFYVLLVGVLFVGLAFSARSLFWNTEEFLYLENMPTVLFAGLFLFGMAMRDLAFRKMDVSYIWRPTVLCALSLLPFVVIVLSLQRASVAAAVLYYALLCLFFISRKPYRIIGGLILGAVTCWVFWPEIHLVLMPMLEKTRDVGANMRPQEFAAVWDIVSDSPAHFLFGIGWGGDFNSPAVGGVRVNFTHSFFSSMLLKAGLFGVVFSFIYIGGLVKLLSKVVWNNPVLGLAIAAPMLIDLTLYASYKSLDFGLVLALIPLSYSVFGGEEFHQETKTRTSRTRIAYSV